MCRLLYKELLNGDLFLGGNKMTPELIWWSDKRTRILVVGHRLSSPFCYCTSKWVRKCEVENHSPWRENYEQQAQSIKDNLFLYITLMRPPHPNCFNQQYFARKEGGCVSWCKRLTVVSDLPCICIPTYISKINMTWNGWLQCWEITPGKNWVDFSLLTRGYTTQARHCFLFRSPFPGLGMSIITKNMGQRMHIIQPTSSTCHLSYRVELTIIGRQMPHIPFTNTLYLPTLNFLTCVPSQGWSTSYYGNHSSNKCWTFSSRTAMKTHEVDTDKLRCHQCKWIIMGTIYMTVFR